jgi:hypothetical protein
MPSAVTAQEPPPPPVDPNFLAFIPALLGAAAESPESAKEAQQELFTMLTAILNQDGVPSELRSGAQDIAEFMGGATTTAPGGPPLPTDGPPISQFLYPTMGLDCIGPGQHSIATALAVSGPAGIPVPGPKKGEAAFVFTALGTGGATGEIPPDPLTVQWLNLDTNKGGQATLDAKARINPDGPTTLSTIVGTERGRVIASIFGSIRTKSEAGPVTCGFAPTVGLIEVQ